MNSTGYVHGAKMGARIATEGARSEHGADGYPSVLEWVRILEATAGNTYRVGVLGCNGEVRAELSGVRCRPLQSLVEGNELWMVSWPGDPLPVLMGGGGAGGGCDDCLSNFGMLEA